MYKFTAKNDPNPARLIESLRHIGYDNYEAIADLLDNSLDADANQIVVRVFQRAGDFHVIIGDNGTGMDSDTLDEALRLGSLTDRDVSTDLGKFGMGLVTASLSLSQRTHVVTRQGKEFLTSIIDVDEVKTSDSFCKHLGPASDADRSLFADVMGDAPTGTVVVLSKTDNLQNHNVTQFANMLRKHLGEVHRYFLLSGKTIAINGEPVKVVDPLQLSDPRTDIFSDESYPIEVEDDATKRTDNIRVRIALVPEDAAAGELDVARGLRNQGFYVLRNNRQVARAETFDFFTKHNDFNRMRGEIFLSGQLDAHVGIEFTKRQVEFSQSLYDQLAQHLKAQCTTIKRQESGRTVTPVSDAQQLYHDQASKSITEKSRLLITPKAAIERRPGKPGGERGNGVQEKESGQERKNFTKTQKVQTHLRCKFLHAQLGATGSIYECDLQGRTVVIRWNTDHPFFKRFVVDNQSDGRLVTAIDFLVYSMACAELRAIQEDQTPFMSTIKAVISANLRTLLS